jgi:hypothetical protein
MSKAESNLATIRDKIVSAFANVPRPSRVTKRVALALDDEWAIDDERGRELYAQDAEQHWQDLTDPEIQEFCSILPWLDDEGLRFYLPAFMSYALRRFPSEDRAVSDIHDLFTSDHDLRSVLSADQLEALVDFEAIYGHERRV